MKPSASMRSSLQERCTKKRMSLWNQHPCLELNRIDNRILERIGECVPKEPHWQHWFVVSTSSVKIVHVIRGSKVASTLPVCTSLFRDLHCRMRYYQMSILTANLSTSGITQLGQDPWNWPWSWWSHFGPRMLPPYAGTKRVPFNPHSMCSRCGLWPYVHIHSRTLHIEDRRQSMF